MQTIGKVTLDMRIGTQVVQLPPSGKIVHFSADPIPGSAGARLTLRVMSDVVGPGQPFPNPKMVQLMLVSDLHTFDGGEYLGTIVDPFGAGWHLIDTTPVDLK